MWKVKLDKDLWLARGLKTTTKESEAYRFPSIKSVQDNLQKIRKTVPYRDAMVIAAFDDL